MLTVVTGATGHVGPNLVRALLDRGRRVRVLVHQSDLGLEDLDVEQAHLDLHDPHVLRQGLQGADVVFHLAARISIVGDPDGSVWSTNVQGPRNVAEAALAVGVRRMVHVSSVHAFDIEPQHGPIRESGLRAVAPDLPVYDRSKAAGEAAVREVVARGLDAVVVHPTGIVGPVDLRLSRMGMVMLQLFTGRMPALIDGGFDWVDVRDVVACLLLAEEKGRTGESYLAGGHWASVQELAELAHRIAGAKVPWFTCPMWLARASAPAAELVARWMKAEPLFTTEGLHALAASRQIDTTKARSELGYEPRPLEETLRDLHAWFVQAGRLEPR